MNRTAAVLNVGCKVSKYDADAMTERLRAAGYDIVDFNLKASVYIINTCTVTNTGDKKSRQLIRRAKQTNENGIVVVTGCYSQVSPDEVSAIDGVDVVVGASGLSKIAEIIDGYLTGKSRKQILVSDINNVRNFEKSGISRQRDRIRAYVKIEDGCDNFCSYCIIPYARGRVRSRPPEDVVEEAARLCQSGINEIVLTGIHVASYGKDLKNMSLSELITEVHEVRGLRRVRLSSLEPCVITEGFVDTLSRLDKFCDYFHLSLQSGCAKTLEAMNRKYTPSQFKDAADIIRAKFSNSAIWSDVIVGFPGETDSDFEESCEFIKKAGINKLHIFPFSPKKGTKAYGMDNQVDSKTKALRAKKLKALDEKLYHDYINKMMGLHTEVLIEKTGQGGYYYGHTKNNILVKLKSSKCAINDIIGVKLEKVIENGVVLCEIE